MPGTISHALSMTSPNDPLYENQPKHWNSSHLATFNLSGSEISGAFGNGGGVSFGLSADGNITAAAPAGAPSPVNISAGTTSNNLASIVFGDSNGISFGLGTGASSRSITATVQTNYLTSQSNQNALAGNGNFNFQTISFSNANNFTFATSAGSAIVGSYTVPTVTNSSWTVSDTATSATVGRLAFTAANGITMTLSTSNNGNHTVFASYTVPTVTNSSWTVSDAATSGTVGRLAFTNLNGVTLSLSTGAGGSHTIVGSHNALTSQSNQAFSDSAGSFTFQTLNFSNANGVTFGTSAGNIVTASVAAGAGGVAAGVSNTGNTLGNTGTASAGTIVWAGSGAITASMSTAANQSTIWYSVAAQTNQSAIKGFGVSNTGNTLGNTGISSGIDWVMAASGGITASESTAGGGPNTVWISAPATSSIVGADGVSISTAGSTISVRLVTLGAFEPLPLANAYSMTYAPAAGTWYMQPMMIPFPISGGRWNIMVAHGSTASNFQATSSASYSNGTTGSLSVTGSYERRIAFYSIGAGGNSTRLESITSANWPLSFTHRVQVASAAGPALTVSQTIQISGITNINSAGATTQSTFSTASNVNSASGGINTTALSSLQSKINDWISSQMMIPIPFNTSLTAGNYYVGMMWNSASGSTSTGALLGSNINTISVVNQYAIFGNTNTAARLALVQTAASSGSAPFPGIGFYSVSSAAPPATMAFSDIRTTASQPLNYINYVNSTF